MSLLKNKIIDNLHNQLSNKSETYKKWHQIKYHSHIHWGIFVFYLILLTLGVIYTNNTYAGSTENTINIEISPGDFVAFEKQILKTNKDTAVANGVDSINISAGYFVIYDNGNPSYIGASPTNPIPRCNADVKFVVSGLNNDYIQETVTNCTSNNGYAIVNLKSTGQGNKTITLYRGAKDPTNPWDNTGLSLNITFTPAPATATTSATTTSTSTSNTNIVTQPTNPTPNNKVAPIISLTKLADAEIDQLTKNANKTLTNKDDFTVSGKTTPNSKVTLYIYSDPITAETISDNEGYWSYKISSLPVGDHRIEATVTDNTGKISDKIVIAKFIVADSKSKTSNTISVPTANIKSRTWIYIGIGIIIVSIIAIFVIHYIKKKKSSTKNRKNITNTNQTK